MKWDSDDPQQRGKLSQFTGKGEKVEYLKKVEDLELLVSKY